MSASVDNVSGSTMAGVHATTTVPAAVLAVFISGMGPIYSVPPRYRMLPQGDKQPDAESNAFGKQLDLRQLSDCRDPSEACHRAREDYR